MQPNFCFLLMRGARNKPYWLVMFFLLTGISFYGQERMTGYQTLRLQPGDSMLVQDTSYLLSQKTYQGMQVIREDYLKCLDQREGDLHLMREGLIELDQQIRQMTDLYEEENRLADSVIEETRVKLGLVMTRLESDIKNMQDMENALVNAREELMKIEKDIRKARRGIFWRNVTKAIVAGFAGIFIGALFF